MSRIGKKPILLSEKIKASLIEGKLQVTGPQGSLNLILPTEISLDIDSKEILVKRLSNDREIRSKHGLVRAMIANMVKGVSEGFKRDLEINGVGYRAEVKGSEVHLSLGFSHPVIYHIPNGIKVGVEKQTKISLLGADKQLVGQVASEIRKIKPPEPYKGKGVKYSNEVVRRKAGKSATGSSGKGK